MPGKAHQANNFKLRDQNVAEVNNAPPESRPERIDVLSFIAQPLDQQGSGGDQDQK